jgi:hypothetical protein
LTKDDPTDHALAAIASILDNRDALTTFDSLAKDDAAKDDSVKADEAEAEHATEIAHLSETAHASETAHGAEIVTVVAERVTVTVISESGPEDEFAEEIAEHESPATVPEPTDIHGYSRSGPGPLDAIRFRWTARRADDGQYYVDETIGSSRPISAGPMPRDEVVQFIDGREFAARQRFDALKTSMTTGHHERIGDDR